MALGEKYRTLSVEADDSGTVVDFLDDPMCEVRTRRWVQLGQLHIAVKVTMQNPDGYTWETQEHSFVFDIPEPTSKTEPADADTEGA